ncbi:MAG: ribosome maturation factor RimP [Pyrinomonadaceae bacterium]
MGKQSVEQRLRAIAERVVRDNGLELVHAEIVGSGQKKTVRIFIDKPAGITHEDCALIDARVSEVLEAEDLIPTAYILEVSSPGLERGLYSISDFEKFTGKQAKVKTLQAINGQKHYRGRIVEIRGEEIVFDDRTSGRTTIPYQAVAKANLEFDIEEELKKAKK